jgi:hypothetical protein
MSSPDSQISETIDNPYYNPRARKDQRSQSQSSVPEAHPLPAFQGPSYVGPSPDYIAPSSSFFFAPEPSRSSLIDFLPTRAAADKLLRQYWLAVHPVVRCVHRPSFERSYGRFWEDVSVGLEPPHSLQALVLAVLFSSVVSMTDEGVMQEFGVQKSGLAENFRMGCEMAIANANFLRTTKLETLQAFVVYLVSKIKLVVIVSADL